VVSGTPDLKKGIIMIFRVGLPRIEDSFSGFDNDTDKRDDIYKADKEPKGEPSHNCVGCMPLFSYEFTAAVITASPK
jgi:hypothetical protein